MAKPHWFPFYVGDFLSSPTVALMTAEEVGGYLLLLCYAWQDPQGSLPNDDDSLRVLSRVRGDLSRIKSCFTAQNARLYNSRLSHELEKSQGKSESARQSNAIRWQNERNANAIRTQSSSQSQSQSQSQSEIQIQIKKETKTLVENEFAQFWEAYPKKVGRKAAQKAFQNAQDRPKIDDLLTAVANQRVTPQWLKEGGQYIPHPATWIHRGQWADRAAPAAPSVFDDFLARGDADDESTRISTGLVIAHEPTVRSAVS